MEWLGFFFFFVLALFVALLLWGTSSILGPKRTNDVKAEPFECGVEPIALPRGRFDIKFYLVAMLFVIFDIELIYLFPWALLYRRLGFLGFIEMLFFLAIVVLGLVYAWKKNALEWE
ncbi:MAG: NADH-quinone oxidoreductase subunit A [Chlamydiota bacterium]|nr:NADH-quinone oxidoreductase subunit A [Chlamydiota bacterium]